MGSCQWRPVVISILLLFTFLTSLLSLIWSVVVWIRLDDLKDNQVGDPEKEFLDDCLRDFEHLSTDSQEYLQERENCMGKLEGDQDLQWLPVIRLTVDDRVCDVEDLCEEGDPGDCKDRGSPGQADFNPGVVTRCYNQIDAAKAERNPATKPQLLAKVEQDCIDSGRWNNYEHKTEIAYCMWKHREAGVCTNLKRGNCPEEDGDTSCCPVAQNRLATPGARPNKYQCAKSPIVGLYCQHVNFTVNASTSEKCTARSCPTFDWCRDYVDVSGQCITAQCEQHRRAKNYAIPVIVFASLGLVLDLGDILILVWYYKAVAAKATVDVAAACMKTLALMMCLTGGIRDFTNDLVDRGCYVEDGSNLAVSARDNVRSFMVSAAWSIVGSLALSPLSAQWGGKLVTLPFVSRGRATPQL